MESAFEVLAEGRRRDILDLLRAGERPVGELVNELHLSQPAVSKHLKVLRDAGLVTERRSGRKRLYRLEPEPLMDLRDWLTPYERFWRERMSDFAALVAEESATEGEPE